MILAQVSRARCDDDHKKCELRFYRMMGADIALESKPGRGPTFASRVRRCEALIAAEDRGLRSFSRPDLSETHCLQCGRLRVRSDELVFGNTCVRASSRDTADQQIGARRRAGRRDPCAGRSIERLEPGDLTELRVAVVYWALQI